MRYLIIFLLLFIAQSARSQTIVGCEQLLATPVGDETAENIVRNCGNFIYCGIDSQDVYNCVKVQVMGMLIFEAREENAKFTYGDLLEKLKEYTARPGYIAFKEKQKKLLGIITVPVTNENWPEAKPILLENGFKPDDIYRMKTLFDKNSFENWTYAQLIQEYANSSEGY
jgi:hypothetical protein